MKKFYLVPGLWVALFSVSAQNVATFESIQLDSASWWNGSDGSGGFSSGGFWFPNVYNQEWGSWSGFSVSNMKDSTTAGWDNQYSAIPASGVNGSENYAVVYTSGELKMEFDDPVFLSGFYATNSTYTYLAMKNGDAYSKKFGGENGDEPDYFKLVVSGADVAGNKTGEIEFFLADFTAENNENDYILNSWKWVDLSSLGVVTTIQFSLESSDVGDWGMNTPAYFCMDDFNGLHDAVSSRLVEQSNVNVFPNPFKNHLNIDLPHSAKNIMLTNQSGQVIFKQRLHNENNIKLTALDSYQAGVYILIIETAGNNISRKVLEF